VSRARAGLLQAPRVSALKRAGARDPASHLADAFCSARSSASRIQNACDVPQNGGFFEKTDVPSGIEMLGDTGVTKQFSSWGAVVLSRETRLRTAKSVWWHHASSELAEL
jgi:hypothetical protein